MATPKEIARGLYDLSHVFGDRLDPRGIELYIRALADLPTSDFAAAVAWLIRNREKYFPTPAEIRRAAGMLDEPAPENEWLQLAGPAPEQRQLSPEDIAHVEAEFAKWREGLSAESKAELGCRRLLAPPDEARPLRPLAELLAGFRLPEEDEPAVLQILSEMEKT